MNKLINGTEYRPVECGYLMQRGKRQLFLLAKSVVQGENARRMMATRSFNSMFQSGVKAPGMKNTAYLRVSNAEVSA